MRHLSLSPSFSGITGAHDVLTRYSRKRKKRELREELSHAVDLNVD